MAAFKIAFMFLFSSAALLSLAHSAFDYHQYCQRTTVASRCNQMIDSSPNQGAKTSMNGVCAIFTDVTGNSAKGMQSLIQDFLGKNPTPRQRTSLQICLDRATTIAVAARQVNCNVINKSTYPTINRLLGAALGAMEDCINSWNAAPKIPNMFPAITTKENEYILADLQLINLFVCNKPTVCS